MTGEGTGGAVGSAGGSLGGAVGAAAFPIPGGPWPFRDTWGAARGGGRTHKGTDVAAPSGTQLVAMFPGVVTFSSDGLGGNTATLVTDRGSFYYAHLSSQRVDLAGQTVPAGTVIGAVGSTGNSSGPHLHLGWLVGGVARNPYELLTQLASGQSAANPYPGTSTTGTSGTTPGGMSVSIPGMDQLGALVKLLAEPAKAFLAAAVWIQDRDNWTRILQVAGAAWLGFFALGLMFGPKALDAVTSAATVVPGAGTAVGAARKAVGA